METNELEYDEDEMNRLAFSHGLVIENAAELHAFAVGYHAATRPIPVSEPPKHCDEVLAFAGVPGVWITCAFSPQDGFISNEIIPAEEVTHWLPLPPEPE